MDKLKEQIWKVRGELYTLIKIIEEIENKNEQKK